MKAQSMMLNARRGWLSFYALMIVVILGFYIAGTQVSSIDQSQAYRLRVFESQAMQSADSALAFALRDTATHSGSWVSMDVPANPHIPRAETKAIWTGNTGVAATSNKMIVWGGKDKNDAFTKFGGIYDPTADSWSLINDSSAPTERVKHTAVWTGTDLIVWGGEDAGGALLNDGGVYNPVSNTWTPTKIGGAPSARSEHCAVWTGTEMIVWGGRDGPGPNDKVDTGRRYDPATDNWSAVSTLNAPSKRSEHSAVWTGTEMIVWGGGGTSPPQPVNTGCRYNPSTNSWQAMNTLNAPLAREDCTTIWTGSEMVVWGGYKNPSPQALGDGGIYNPAQDDLALEPWRAIASSTEVPSRRDNAAVFMDGVIALWGGFTKPAAGPNQATNSGCAIRVACGHWGLITEAGAPSARYDVASAWTGTHMVIWGGKDNSDNILDDGKRWLPPAGASGAYEMQISSAQVFSASLTYDLSSYTPAIVTATATVLDMNGREIGGRSAKSCLDVERHKYNKGCWSR